MGGQGGNREGRQGLRQEASDSQGCDLGRPSRVSLWTTSGTSLVRSDEERSETNQSPSKGLPWFGWSSQGWPLVFCFSSLFCSYLVEPETQWYLQWYFKRYFKWYFKRCFKWCFSRGQKSPSAGPSGTADGTAGAVLPSCWRTSALRFPPLAPFSRRLWYASAAVSYCASRSGNVQPPPGSGSKPKAPVSSSRRSSAVAYFSPSWTAFQADRGRCFSVMVDGISN